MERNPMNETAWTKLEEEKSRRQPTPPISEPVTWYIEGDRNRPVAAQCNGIEGPGRISVVVFPKNAFPQHRTGCHHISHPIHEKPNSTTRNCGAWDYPRGKVPKDDYALHDKELAKREEGLLVSEEQAQKAQQEFQAKKAEREAALKKRLPEILPSPF
jgi:hypothetical protein